jgi:hypothetical protein
MSNNSAYFGLPLLTCSRYCDQLTQLPKSEEWSATGSLERMGAQEWESALDVKIDSV